MTAKTEERKARVLSELAEARSRILDVARKLPAAKRDEVFLGTWSATDLVAHLIGWDYANLQAMRELLQGELPSFYAHHDRDWRSYNAQLVRQYRRDDFEDLLAEADASHRQVLAALSSLSAEEIVADRGVRYRGWKVTIERLMLADVRDGRTHAAQVAGFADKG